jgi:hypothetical protein
MQDNDTDTVGFSWCGYCNWQTPVWAEYNTVVATIGCLSLLHQAILVEHLGWKLFQQRNRLSTVSSFIAHESRTQIFFVSSILNGLRDNSRSTTSSTKIDSVDRLDRGELTGKALQGLTFLEGAFNAFNGMLVGVRVAVLVYCCGSLSCVCAFVVGA